MLLQYACLSSELILFIDSAGVVLCKETFRGFDGINSHVLRYE